MSLKISVSDLKNLKLTYFFHYFFKANFTKKFPASGFRICFSNHPKQWTVLVWFVYFFFPRQNWILPVYRGIHFKNVRGGLGGRSTNSTRHLLNFYLHFFDKLVYIRFLESSERHANNFFQQDLSKCFFACFKTMNAAIFWCIKEIQWVENVSMPGVSKNMIWF